MMITDHFDSDEWTQAEGFGCDETPYSEEWIKWIWR